MQQLENNAFFWQKLDTLLLSSSCTIDRPKGSAHYKFTNLIYPVDYGFLSDTFGSDQKQCGCDCDYGRYSEKRLYC